MKAIKVRKCLWWACLSLGLGIFGGKVLSVHAAEGNGFNWETIHTYGSNAIETTKVCVQTVGDENVMFMPSTISPNAVALNWEADESTIVSVQGSEGCVQILNGEIVDLTTICSGENYEIAFQIVNNEMVDIYEVEIIFSSHVDSMYLVEQP